MAHTRELSEGSEQFIFELPSLIVVEFGRVSESRDKVIKNLVCSSFTGLVFSGVCLGKPGKVVNYHQDILVPTTAELKVEKVNADEFKG